ncbi:MAG: hypothetical protein KC422_00080 [Trueperaceae bacterium]|nr:hypothetical protein [Trueperaceae bacterium]
MYIFLKALHSIVRWIVVLGGVYAIILALRGLFTKAHWGINEKRAGLIFTNALNIQFVIGLILYFISPLGARLFSAGDMAAVMGNKIQRFFAVEHLTIMILALVAAQLGYSLAKRAKTDQAKFVRASVGYVLAGLLLAYGIPWWRPLFPGL